MLRLFAAAVAALMMLVVPALAGDRASLNVMGYSEDGRYFAFEEVGEHDLVEGYYDHIYVIDLSDDSWVKNTPYIVDVDQPGEDQLSYVEVRKKAMEAAAPLLKALKIGLPANIDMLLPDSIPNEDGKVMIVNSPTCCFANDVDTDHAYKLLIKTYEAKIEEPCRSETAFGFSLTDVEFDGTTRVLHQDGDVLPKSRGCPQDYRLYGVFSPAGALNAPSVAIVSFYFYEDEGYSRHFIAVPLSKWAQPDAG